MTADDTRYEALREAIATKTVSYEDMRDNVKYALLEALQALDYGDWRYVEERALFAADVAKGLARR